jgi:hypothetical protein
VDVLTDALPEDEVHEWLADEPAETSDLIADRERYRGCWQGAERLIDMMPEKFARPAAQEQVAEAIWARARESRDRFLRAHAREVYGAVTMISRGGTSATRCCCRDRSPRRRSPSWRRNGILPR